MTNLLAVEVDLGPSISLVVTVIAGGGAAIWRLMVKAAEQRRRIREHEYESIRSEFRLAQVRDQAESQKLYVANQGDQRLEIEKRTNEVKGSVQKDMLEMLEMRDKERHALAERLAAVEKIADVFRQQYNDAMLKIQELVSKNQTLEQENHVLKEQLAELKRELAAMQVQVNSKKDS